MKKYRVYDRRYGGERELSCTGLLRRVQAILDNDEQIRTHDFIFYSSHTKESHNAKTEAQPKGKPKELSPRGSGAS